MRQFGKVEIPQEAFIAALKIDADQAIPLTSACRIRRRKSLVY